MPLSSAARQSGNASYTNKKDVPNYYGRNSLSQAKTTLKQTARGIKNVLTGKSKLPNPWKL